MQRELPEEGELRRLLRCSQHEVQNEPPEKTEENEFPDRRHTGTDELVHRTNGLQEVVSRPGRMRVCYPVICSHRSALLGIV